MHDLSYVSYLQMSFFKPSASLQLTVAVYSRSQLPRVLHHNFEVLVSINGAADIAHVVTELVEGDDAVSDLGVPEAHELLVSLLGCALL